MEGMGRNGESAKGSGLSSHQEVLMGRKKSGGPARTLTCISGRHCPTLQRQRDTGPKQDS